MSYTEDFIRLKALIQERFGLDIIENSGLECGSMKGASSYRAAVPWLGLKADIMLNTTIPRYQQFSTLAHELGHHLDFLKGCPEWRGVFGLFHIGHQLMRHKRPWIAKQGKFLVRKALPAILLREQAAWDLGFQFLRDNGFYVDTLMMQDQDSAMAWYRRQGK